MAVVSVAASTRKGNLPGRLSRRRSSGASPNSRWRNIFSSTMTELSINREKASANPPNTMALTVLPPNENARNAASAESGIQRKTATVAYPAKKIKIIARSRQGRSLLREPDVDRRLDENGLIEDNLRDPIAFGTSSRCPFFLIPSTTAIVLVSPPCFITGK